MPGRAQTDPSVRASVNRSQRLDSVVLGFEAGATRLPAAERCIFIGQRSRSVAATAGLTTPGNVTDSVAIGCNATIGSSTFQATSAIVIGSGPTTALAPLASHPGSIAIGSHGSGFAGARATNGGAIAIGNSYSSTAGAAASGTESIAIGTSTTTATNTNSIAIGTNATASGDRGIAIGRAATAGAAYAVALSGSATGAGSVAIGRDSGAAGASTSVDNEIKLGTGNHTTNIIGNAKIAGSGKTLGFYGATAITKPTGVAVDAAGIHAALVSLGLIAA